MSSSLSIVVVGVLALGAATLCLAQENGVPVTLSRVKNRQKFSLQDMAVDLFGQRPVTDQGGVQVRQVTDKEMPVLGLLYQLEQVQHRLIDMAPCSANTPNVAPKHAVFNYGFKGKTSVGVIQNRQGKVLNTIAKEQATFFPQGMVFFEANLDCQPAQVFQVLASIRSQDIFPEKQLVQKSTADIASLFGISAQEAAAIKSAAQANSQADPMAALISQCKAKCANGGGDDDDDAGPPGKGGKQQPPAKGGKQQPTTKKPTTKKPANNNGGGKKPAKGGKQQPTTKKPTTKKPANNNGGGKKPAKKPAKNPANNKGGKKPVQKNEKKPAKGKPNGGKRN